MRRPGLRLLAGGILALLAFTSCLGPNHATGHMFKWNGSIENRWGRSIVFVVCLPVYFITSLGDSLIFNSIQWWTGDNPISRPGGNTTITTITVGDQPAAAGTVEEVSR